jgi:hypothetical protein
MRRGTSLAVLAAVAALAAVGAAAIAGASGSDYTGVAANTKAPGYDPPSNLSPELQQHVVAQGSMALENPTDKIGYYGYLKDGPLLPVYGDVQSATHNVEASKTEPDKNTYLVLRNQTGADPQYDYGTHFLYQGHETGSAGYITRINLDADSAHRVTLMASTDVNGKALPNFDGSVWDPFAKRLLFSFENGSGGGIWSSTLEFPSKVTDISGLIGKAGYEGMQLDDAGNIWIVEDSGGKLGTANPHAKQPNSFIYRFVPTDPTDLSKGGRLQALQVFSNRTGNPIVFGGTATPAAIDGDITSPDRGDLHTYGITFKTHWVTVHDTATDGTTPFDANALAKAASATPFKRPENGQFRAGQSGIQFFFTETGDTDSRTEAGSAFGGFGGLYRIDQKNTGSQDGTLQLFYNSDVAHTGFDNLTFLDRNHLIVVEDAGDTLHTQRNALDSAYLFDVRIQGPQDPVRIIGQGRDPSAAIDSSLLGQPGFQNEGDNEITGIHESNGDPSVSGLIGRPDPTPFRDGWRLFYTGQHGENATYEVTKVK